MTPDFTVVVGLDAKTLPYFASNCPTWKRFHPELWERRWAVFYDETQISHSEIKAAALGAPIRYHSWNGTPQGYESQREKMLSGHVFVSRLIETPYFLKIDADSIAVSRGDAFPQESWFEGDPVLVGPSWGYTRAKGNGKSLVEWCRELEAFGDRHYGGEQLGWEQRIGSWDHPKGPKVRDRNRFVSWLGFQQTEWVCRLSKLFEQDYGMGRLPVPSHDTSLWACAVRSGAPTRVVKVKPHWINRVTLRGCREQVKQIMEKRHVNQG